MPFFFMGKSTEAFYHFESFDKTFYTFSPCDKTFITGLFLFIVNHNGMDIIEA